MLIDSGSTHDFISLDFARKNNLEIESQDGSDLQMEGVVITLLFKRM